MRTKGGGVCEATQPLHVYEYAPVWMYWKAGNNTEYSGAIDLAMPLTEITTDGKSITYTNPKTYDDFAYNGFGSNVWMRIWDDTYSLYFEYLGKAL